jgi:hypothetical protein
MDRPLSQRVLRHRKILVNRYEETADAQLNEVAQRNSARVFPKLRVADVLEIDGSGISGREYRYALQAHFDFVVAETDGTPYFAVEFDGPQHTTDPDTIQRDRLKDSLCQRFGLPLLRIDADYLRTSGRFTLLGWLVDLWFLYEAFCEAQDNGSVPDDEPFFIPSFIELAPGGGVRSIYDLGQDARLLMYRAYRDGVCLEFCPEIVHRVPWDVGPGGPSETYALLRLSEGGVLIGHARCRTTRFVPGCDSELVEGLAMVDLGAKLRRHLEGEPQAVGEMRLAKVRQATQGKGWMRSGVLQDDVLPTAGP